MSEPIPESSLDEALRAAYQAGVTVSPDLVNRLERRFIGTFTRNVSLDALDVVAICLAGAVGAAIDVLLVAIPKDVTYLGKHPQQGSVLTKLFKSWCVPSDNKLASLSNVPFDTVASGSPEMRIAGMYPKNHRFMTPGHDPLLGFVVGVFDILRGGQTAIDRDGVLRYLDSAGPGTRNVPSAIAVECLHLLSDVATKCGLPAPLMTLTGALRLGSFGDRERTLADLARYMYVEGYDLRHFATTCTSPAAIRMCLATYFLGRRWCDAEYRSRGDAIAEKSGKTLSHRALRLMSICADSIACAANAGKIALYAGNPSAFNYGQWLALCQGAITYAIDSLESPTQVLTDRAAANEKSLNETWKLLSQSLALPPDPADCF